MSSESVIPAPTVSIVMVVLNAVEDVALTLRSVAAQTASDFEVVVMDGGSTDGTVDVVRSFDLPITLVSEPDEGIYDAMNKGAARARGKWLQFLNAGDVYSGVDSLSAVTDRLDVAESAGRTWLVAGAKYVGGPTDGQPVSNLPHVWYRHALGMQPHCHQATWFRSDLFTTLGGYSLDYDFVGDFDLILRWGLTGAPEEIYSLVIDYARGGISDQREKEIPALLDHVRADRMQLGRITPVFERVLPAIRFTDRASRALQRRARALRAVAPEQAD
jgi:glycosyltransferase involved in cell wall biosynthesis